MDWNDEAQAILVADRAARMLELVHDLGECTDSRQTLVAAIRHFHVLFGGFVSFSLLLDDPQSGSWRLLTLENPYATSWGGVAVHMLPHNTEVDEIARSLGRDITGWVGRDHALHRLVDSSAAEFDECDTPLTVRLANLTGAPARCFLGASSQRPLTGNPSWMILGYTESVGFSDSLRETFTTAVHTASRMASYPALVNSLARNEKINQSVRRNIVHDLKTPVTVIQGYAETLRLLDDADPETVTELLDGIVEACGRLLEDIHDILEPVERAWVPKLEPVELGLLVHKAVLAESHTERSMHHKFHVEGDKHAIIVNGDYRKLRRVVENLISNAVKYSPGENKQVVVTLYTTKEDVRIAVTDEGMGMNDVQLARVMNDGGRAVDDSLGIEGSGFGLSSSQLVLNAHGGRLEAVSTPNLGSTFTIVLPHPNPPNG